MNELTMNEMEQVNGGPIWFAPAAKWAAGSIVTLGGAYAISFVSQLGANHADMLTEQLSCPKPD